MTIGIIDYGSGNIFSVLKTLERCGVQTVVSSDPDTLQKTDKIIFPGVGHAAPALYHLKKNNLDQWICSCQKPFLGICLGMQLLGDFLEEAGQTGCRIVPQSVQKFLSGKIIPHMGWNAVFEFPSILFEGITPGTDFYFVHSYRMETGPCTTSICQYENEIFSSSIEKENFFGVQFHPEKSGSAGEILLKNFLFKT